MTDYNRLGQVINGYGILFQVMSG